MNAESGAADKTERTRVVLVTGMSGAGRTLALKALEDMGYEAVDNLPLSLVGRMLDPSAGGGGHAIAIAVDFRTRDFAVETLGAMLGPLRARPDLDVRVIFLTADDDVLRRRFTETRRRHPLADDRPVPDGIRHERELLTPLVDRVDHVLDTSRFTGHELRHVLAGHFGLSHEQGLRLALTSFAFRRGLPREADLVFDVRFLTNPYYEPALRNLSGRDDAVAEYIAADPGYVAFIERLDALLLELLPRYADEGKSYLTVAIGCTGGQHRSVFVAESLAARLREHGHAVQIRHRDVTAAADDQGKSAA